MTLIKFKNDFPSSKMERMPYISELFNDFFDTMITPDFRRSTVPAVNINETEDRFTLQMAAPGMNKEDFKINLENDLLTVSGEVKKESDEKNEKFTRKEFSYTSFKRSFTLPEIVDSSRIEGSYENGLMTLLLPKKDEAKPKVPKEIKIS